MMTQIELFFSQLLPQMNFALTAAQNHFHRFLHVRVGEFIQSYISIGVISNYYQHAHALILSCKPARGATCLLVMNGRCNPNLFPYLHSNEGRITQKKTPRAIGQPLYHHTLLTENRPQGEITSAFIPLIGQ